MNNKWKPKLWVAIVLGLAFQSFTFLYLNRQKLFWLYLLLIVLVSCADWYYGTFVSLAFITICPIHAYFLVKNYDMSIKRSWSSTWWGIPTLFVSIVIPIFLIKAFFYELFVIPAASMSPTLNVGDYILVKKFGFGTYKVHGITFINTEVADKELMQRGKMYVFYPPHTEVQYVKRLMALPGDTIVVNDNEILVNGSVLPLKLMYKADAEKIYEERSGEFSYFIRRTASKSASITNKLIVPEDSYFFMGDNRENSADSRMWGFVSSDRIIGEVKYVFLKNANE